MNLLTQAETGLTGVLLTIGWSLGLFALAFTSGFLVGHFTRRKPLAREKSRYIYKGWG